MILLGLDTATEACSVALSGVGAGTVERCEWPGRGHARRVLPMIEAVLEEGGVARADVEAVAYGCGPGSFTGIRVGAGVAHGLAAALGVPILAVSSLQAMAQGTGANEVATALDARMDQVYWACYRRESGLMREVVPAEVAAPQSVTDPGDGDWLGAGPGWGRYAEALAAATGISRHAVDAHPRAADVVTIARRRLEAGDAGGREKAMPRYVRDRVARSGPG